MLAGTSPSLSLYQRGIGDFGYEAAINANTGVLYVAGPLASGFLGVSMMAGTSPAIAVLNTNTSFVVAAQGANGHLWIATASSSTDTGLAMKAGTSPAIAD